MRRRLVTQQRYLPLLMAVLGFSITPAELASQVAAFITSSAASGWSNLGVVIGGLKNSPELRWANPLEVKNAVEAAFTERFGEKTTAQPKSKVHQQSLFCVRCTYRSSDSGCFTGTEERRCSQVHQGRELRPHCLNVKIRVLGRFSWSPAQTGREPSNPPSPT